MVCCGWNDVWLNFVQRGKAKANDMVAAPEPDMFRDSVAAE